MRKSQKIGTLVLAALCLAVWMPGIVGAETDGDWREVYADKVLEEIGAYNALDLPEKCGIFADLIDLNFDGTPELYVGYLEQGQMQMGRIIDSRVYTLRDGQATSLPKDVALSLQTGSQHTEQNQTYLAREDRTDGHLVVLIKRTQNEGVHDSWLSFIESNWFSDDSLSELIVFDRELPEELRDEADEAIEAYFDQESETFLRNYTVLATAIDTAFYLRSESDWNGPLAFTHEEILARVSEYRHPEAY